MSCLTYYFATLWGNRKYPLKLGLRVFVRQAVMSAQNDTGISGIVPSNNGNKNFDSKKKFHAYSTSFNDMTVF